MPEKIIMHLDMNSYFASVEQQANPFLRGRPVGVCAYLSPNGTIIASSREAKAHGVKTGCHVGEARRLIPDIELVENEPAKYRCTTDKIFKILAEYTDALEPYSIDEAFLDLTGWFKDFKAAHELAEQIKIRIKTEVGEWLDCSIGISFTKFLAKFAGDIAPKAGILIIAPDKLDEYLNCDPREAWGIGAAIADKLKYLGIKTLLDLKHYDQFKLKKVLGIYGYYLWANVNGLEISEISDEATLPKSIGHSYCIPQKTKDKVYLLKILFKLCEKTGRRLRALGLEAGSANLYLSYLYGGHLTKTFRPADSIFTTRELFDPLESFINEAILTSPVNQVAVSVNRLVPLSGQQTIFFDRTKQKNISLALDQLNDRYGEYTVASGLMFDTDGLAHDRIGFRKTLEVKREDN